MGRGFPQFLVGKAQRYIVPCLLLLASLSIATSTHAKAPFIRKASFNPVTSANFDASTGDGNEKVIPRDSLYLPRQMAAVRTSIPPKIDGQLDDDCWQFQTTADRFLTTEPKPGIASALASQVWVVYDDDALYIAAFLSDPSTDSIELTLSQRDEAGNADWMGVLLSPYDDGANGFGFGVTSAGVQIDEKWTGFNSDRSWDAVWESATRVGDDGWYVEMALPYGALRFKSSEVQVWGINFYRHIRRFREDSWWSPVDVAESGFLQQEGTLTGLQNIKAPFRLSITPYVSTFVELRSDPSQGTTDAIWDVNGGMDLKYGINDAFTLDMTLIPDFNQVRFDNQVLNLSPFEVRFDENRAFFTEGTELFNKQGLFYSRRIGGRPVRYFDVFDQVEEGEELLNNPAESRLYNATKVSGRTNGGLGIGVFNAITAETQATILGVDGVERNITTAPLTNYNVFVLDQNLKRDNSFITLTNTNVGRNGQFEESNVTGLLFRYRDKKGRYQVETNGVLSQQYPDNFNEVELGHTAGINLSKISGNFRFNTGYYEESDTYDPNDLGFLFANNERAVYLDLNYDIYEPFWRFNQLFNYIGSSYQRIYQPREFANLGIYSESVQIWKNFTASGINFNAEPIITYDWFEPRVQGRFLEYPVNYRAGTWVSTDYRKTLAIDVRTSYRWFNGGDRSTFFYFVAPRWQVNDKMLMIASFERQRLVDDLGWVNQLEDGSIIIGQRDITTSETGLQVNYIFTNRMFLTLRVRHYWSKAAYSEYHDLGLDGKLYATEYDGINPENGLSNHDVNFNAFTVDAGFTWRFAPGSDLFFVWKEGIFNSSDQLEKSYFSNLEQTFRSPQSNNLSLRIVYYLDYVQVKKWSRNNSRDHLSPPLEGDAYRTYRTRSGPPGERGHHAFPERF